MELGCEAVRLGEADIMDMPSLEDRLRPKRTIPVHVCAYVCIYIYIYIYIYVLCIHLSLSLYIYIYNVCYVHIYIYICLLMNSSAVV